MFAKEKRLASYDDTLDAIKLSVNGYQIGV
jgi:hypothetical protein